MERNYSEPKKGMSQEEYDKMVREYCFDRDKINIETGEARKPILRKLESDEFGD